LMAKYVQFRWISHGDRPGDALSESWCRLNGLEWPPSALLGFFEGCWLLGEMLVGGEMLVVKGLLGDAGCQGDAFCWLLRGCWLLGMMLVARENAG